MGKRSFAVINADDFYDCTAFSEIYDFLVAQTDESQYAMVGYRLRNTVTEFGSMARGVCEIENGLLAGVTERTFPPFRTIRCIAQRRSRHAAISP